MVGELAEQVARLRASNPAGLDKGTGHTWMAQLGDLVLPLPNFAWRREALDLHDANHLTTGYDFSPAGECRLAAWELGCGCYRSLFACALCLALLVVGMVFGPVAILKALRRGRQVSAQANLPDPC